MFIHVEIEIGQTDWEIEFTEKGKHELLPSSHMFDVNDFSKLFIGTGVQFHTVSEIVCSIVVKMLL